MRIYFCFILFLSTSLSLIAQQDSEIIKISKIETDYKQNGAIGIRIRCESDFKFLREKYPNDSLYRKAIKLADFSIKTTIFQRAYLIQPSYGYNTIKREDGNLELKNYISNPNGFSEKEEIITYIFIPYACMKLPAMTQTIELQLNVIGKDANEVSYNQEIKSKEIKFTKPETKTFSLEFDSLVVNPFNTKGKAWDYTYSRSDAPDIDLTIKIGDLSIGKIHQENSYSVNFPNNPQVFTFHISVNDNITLNLVDEDVFFHDHIANWLINTENMKDNIFYEQNDKKPNLSSFHFKFKVQ